jgi:Rrf2 family cysteine metabolism transcriptional repressor
MISVTAKSRYAVVGMAELSRHADRPVPISVVAERREIPVQFLEQLFSTLRRAGLLVSQRGVKGGFRLARPAEEITVLEVVQALDGRIGDEASEAGGIWADGVEALRRVFAGSTIADVARREEAEEGGSGMYFI